MDIKKQGNKDVRERILLLQREKDEVGRSLCSSVVNSIQRFISDTTFVHSTYLPQYYYVMLACWCGVCPLVCVSVSIFVQSSLQKQIS